MTMLPLYAHETQGHMCKHADVHCTEQKVLRVALRRWGDDESVLRHCSHSRRWHHTVSKISGEKKNGAVYVVQAAEVNHDGARPPLKPPLISSRHELPQEGWRSPFTGEDGLRRREGLRARHSTVHSGHIIMTFTRAAREIQRDMRVRKGCPLNMTARKSRQNHKLTSE